MPRWSPWLRLAAALAVAALAVVVYAWVGLALFRRGWSRRALRWARRPDVELAFGPPWVVLERTARFAARHPRSLRWGLFYALHLTVGIDPLARLGDETLRRAVTDARRGRGRDPPA
ncbi:MAG TPA: hypothetical protein RMH99_11465 [Sandaracinaceae bacterium LLY-WYZ-13_1]|nr:hypothetical protein [Sandaracinaceae bacterium LLY-WYZ-13_1]